MFRIHASIQINRPVEDVFAFVTDPARIPDWQPAIQEITDISSRKPGVGTKFIEKGRLGLVKTAIVWEIIDFEPNVSCTFRSDSFLATTEVTFLVSEIDGRTLYEAAQKAAPKGLFKLAEPLLERQTLRQRRTYMADIKRILESRP